MTYRSTSFRMGPQLTPQAIKNLILYTTIITALAAVTNNLFVFFLKMPGPMEWLSLSWWGINHYYLWQPVTFLFTYHTGEAGITISFLLDFAFYMFMLWIFGTDIYNRIGKSSFLKFYFLSGILAGLITLLLMPITKQYGVISGATPSILSLLIFWTMMNPETELQLFFLIPIKAKWLTLGVAGSMILLNLANVNIIHFFLYLSAAMIGYFYGLIAWGLHSPFPLLYKFELSVLRFCNAMLRRTGFLTSKLGKKPTKKDKSETIVDITTGKSPQDDNRFIDAMLEKISKHGESSLSWQERERMEKISEKRRKEKSDHV